MPSQGSSWIARASPALEGGFDTIRRDRIRVVASAPLVPEQFNAAAFFVDRHLTDGNGGRRAFRFRGENVTYARLAERANRAGNAWRGLGVEIENRVVLILRDSPDLAAAFWGALKIGAVAVPLNPALSAEEYRFLLGDGRAKLVVVEDDVADRVLAARAHCPFLRHVVTTGKARDGALALGDLLEAASADLAVAPTQGEDVAYWGYTSGSTGRPKAAVHPHADFLYAADRVGVGVFGIGAGDLVFSASKIHFAFGLGNSLYFPARVGGAALLVPDRVDAEGAFEIIARERPTVFFAVATLYARMLHVPDAASRYDLSSLRLCVSSGEALPPAVFHAWRERFGLELVDVLGSTEALHDFIANRPGHARAGSAGQVIPGFEVRLVDERGVPVIPGSVGHLWIKGDTTAPCYWNRREQTRRTMQGEWLRTGDMLFVDTDGYYYFCGRADDMLRVGGMWVSPAEVEAALVEHPAVVEAGVVGRHDADGLVRAHAFVVLAAGVSGTQALEGELREHVRKRLAGYKAPRWVEFVPELPKTPTGKIQRFRLRSGG
jgi:benzoate-CoA ligase family protein